MARRAEPDRFPVAVIGPGALGTLFAGRRSKVYDTAAALRTARRMKPKAVISLQNGLVDSVPQGVTTAAAYREGKRAPGDGCGKVHSGQPLEHAAGHHCTP